MSVLRVTCISMDKASAEPKISGVGGVDFYHTAEEVISWIDNRTHQYWAEIGGESVWLRVATDQEGNPFLAAQNTGSETVDIFSLHECQKLDNVFALGEVSEELMQNAGDFTKGSPDEIGERLALRTVVRLLVLNRYGRDDARLARNREDAISRAGAAIDRLELGESDSKQLHTAVKRHLELLFAPPTQR